MVDLPEFSWVNGADFFYLFDFDNYPLICLIISLNYLKPINHLNHLFKPTVFRPTSLLNLNACPIIVISKTNGIIQNKAHKDHICSERHESNKNQIVKIHPRKWRRIYKRFHWPNICGTELPMIIIKNSTMDKQIQQTVNPTRVFSAVLKISLSFEYRSPTYC